jgi:hypothetical protein
MQKKLKMPVFTCFFSLGDLTFSITAQKRFELGEKLKQINHLDELAFI